MAKFKFVGNGDNDPSNMTAFGLVFRVSGESRVAETDDQNIIKKLRGNSHFDEVNEPKESKSAKTEAAKPAEKPGKQEPHNEEKSLAESLSELTGKELQACAKERYGVDLAITKKSSMVETIVDLEAKRECSKDHD